MNTDVFHIYPTDIKVNSQRGNNPYGVCANGTRLTYDSYVAKGKLGSSTYPGYSGTVFEPDDEYKGDLARTYFYMVTCYKNELPSWPGSPNINYSQNKYKAFSTKVTGATGVHDLYICFSKAQGDVRLDYWQFK
jgi:endonuclease I